MHRTRTALAAALLAALAGGQAIGQATTPSASPPAPAPASPAPASPAPASAPAPAARPWQVDWGQYYCSLIRKPGEGRPFATAFVATPGNESMSIRLVGERGADLPTGLNNIVLLPAGTTFPVEVNVADRRETAMRSLYGLPAEFWPQLMNSAELLLQSGDRIRARVPLDGIRGARAAHRQCTGEVSREWGIDEAALAALRRRPRTTNFLGLRPEDYPAAALRRATQGRVIVRIGVGADGRATDCATVATSGSPEIDATACRVAMSRGRFEAGLDAAGQPVATRAVYTATFYLPAE
ncbi:MAG TPA: energy transducer TonB [Allosphingosinicella sp.]|nr:energy transducer TonB [Allosphingosinicella sp.]